MEDNEIKVGVVGLGYVGLPLAVAFGRTSIPTVGYDRDAAKIQRLKEGFDPNDEVSPEELRASRVEYSDDPSVLRQANVIIAAIPTPVTSANVPDLRPVESASKIIGENLQKGSIVVFESTVYPGVTEEICVPILEQASGLKYGIDFKVGYSPERINPGDKEHTLERIPKVVAGCDEETLKRLSWLYGQVVKAGIHEAPTIKVAEAAKVIENIQRDLNIALINELSLIFRRMGIETLDVLAAAETKWNFHRYRPGLVGGHCIGVDPYYLTYRAQQMGYHPQVILAGRRVNDGMPRAVVDEMIKGLAKSKRCVAQSKVLILGVTFKEDVRDTRNSKVKEVVKELKSYDVDVHALDPLVSLEEIEQRFKAHAVTEDRLEGPYQGVIIASPHKMFTESLDAILKHVDAPGVVIDLKGSFRGRLKSNPSLMYLSL